MADFKMPYGAEFSPDYIDIKQLLKMAADYSGVSANDFIEAWKKKYTDNKTMANNCKNSMVAYQILEEGGGITLTPFGQDLASMKKEADIYDAMAKRILTYLNGLMFIEAIRTITSEGSTPTLVSVTETLNLMGCEKLSGSNKHVPTMKKWLEKAKVIDGWNIKEKKLSALIGIDDEGVAILKGLSHEQACFVRALCNSETDDYQNASAIRDLATASYNVKFPVKNFAQAIINPLVDKGIIDKKASASSHGGNAAEIKIIDSVKKEVLAPVIEQIEILAGKEVIKYCQKSLKQLREDIDSKNTHVRGLALEAFAIKMMRIIDLDFAGTRVKGSQTGGAEVDVLFDTTRLNYSRWQVQCKNTDTVSLDQVAKEVGLVHVLKSNVIVILTTGNATQTAKEFANSIMRDMNLCIIFIEKDDVKEILESPASIVDVLNRESMKAKRIKVLDKIEE